MATIYETTKFHGPPIMLRSFPCSVHHPSFISFIPVSCSLFNPGDPSMNQPTVEKQQLKDRITPQVNFFQQATKERQRRHGVSKKEKRDGEGLVWSKLCVDEYV